MQTRIRDVEQRRRREAYQKKLGGIRGRDQGPWPDHQGGHRPLAQDDGDKACAEARLAFKSRKPGAEARTGFLNKGALGRSVPQMVPVDTPRVLFILKARATYQPVLQPSWTAAAEAAVATLPARLEKELAEKAAFRASRTSS